MINSNGHMKPIRVLHLLHDSRRSGVPAVAYSLLTSLDRTRVEASALFAYDGVYAEDLRQAGFEVHTFGRRTPLLWRLKSFLAIPWLLLNGRNYDLIHVHSIVMAISAWVLKLLGRRVVFHLHEKGDTSGLFLRKAMAGADCVVFCAKNCAAHYSSLPAKRSMTILNAIRLPEAGIPSTAAPRRKIVMLGSINRNKGQDILLKAFARLQRDDAELSLYGTVGLSARGFVAGLHRFVHENGLTAKVFFPGPTADAAAVLSRADLLVHASLNECLSISILEAMAHGVPVIANDIAGMREIIRDGVNGLLSPPGDVEALAEKIALLLDDPALRQRISSAGRETVERHFNMDSRVREFERLYGELTEAPDSRRDAP